MFGLTLGSTTYFCGSLVCSDAPSQKIALDWWDQCEKGEGAWKEKRRSVCYQGITPSSLEGALDL